MLLKVIRNLKDINAEHLLENKWQPYAEGVEYARDTFNSIIMLTPIRDIETRIKMNLAHAYSDREGADNNAEKACQTGMIDFYEYVLEYEP